MVADLKIPVTICPCPIVREADGLALSSRNALLSADERNLAVNISKILFASKEFATNHTVGETLSFVVNSINAHEGLEVEYYEIVDGDSLQKVSSWNESDSIVGCITVYCGQLPVRLIDNIRYK